MDLSGLEIEDGRVCLMGAGLSSIPPEVAERFAAECVELDLSDNSISTLEDLAPFLNLRSLILDKNCVDSLATLPVEQLSKLETLWINRNQLRDVEEIIEVASRLPSLNYLSLLMNPCAPHFMDETKIEDYQNFRHYILYRLPRLTFLDSGVVSPEELAAARQRGPYLKVARPSAANRIVRKDAEEHARHAREELAGGKQGASAEDGESSAQGQPGAYFGYTRYLYCGKQSEGNRFILNKDL